MTERDKYDDQAERLVNNDGPYRAANIAAALRLQAKKSDAYCMEAFNILAENEKKIADLRREVERLTKEKTGRFNYVKSSHPHFYPFGDGECYFCRVLFENEQLAALKAEVERLHEVERNDIEEIGKFKSLCETYKKTMSCYEDEIAALRAKLPTAGYYECEACHGIQRVELPQPVFYEPKKLTVDTDPQT